MHARFPAHNNIRENKGLGIDLAYLSLNLDERLIITLKIEGKDFPGLLDTGADRSIIRKEDWPKRWPLQASSQTLQGLGYAKAPEISAKELTWTYQEGQEGKFQPFVVELPITLWGQDVLSQMNFMLTTEYSEASRNMMRNSGFIPGKGATGDEIPIPWTTNTPVWVPQWPLSQEKLEAAKVLVEEQLALGHLEPSQSPWNTPIFVIKKKSGKWRLLHDLRAVNKQMQLMGPVQRGLPVLSGLPQDWAVIILDIKDCFFSIPLAKEDCCRFAFTLPSVNHEQPDARYQWRVLPQGMSNSPTICQLFVHQALVPTRREYPQVRIIHYMDDILLAAPSQAMLDKSYAHTVQALEKKGLHIAPEKVQKDSIGKFLGAVISPKQIRPQKMQIRLDHLKTLNDFQKLLGDINWVRPYLSISTAELKPLFKILEGDSSVTSPRIPNSEARTALAKVETAITNAQLNRIDDTLPLSLCVLPTKIFPTAVLWQKGPLLWIHPHASPGRTIEYYPTSVASLALQGIKLALTHFATEPQLLIQPYTPKQVQVLAATVDEWAVLVCSFSGVLDNHYPKDNLLLFIIHHPVIFPKVTAMEPFKGAIEIYTDGSKSGVGAYVLQGQDPVQFRFQPNTPQIVECQIVSEVFKRFHEPFNLLSDSHYVVSAVRGLETSAFIKESSPVHDILWDICVLIQDRTAPFFIGHIRAHTLLPGPMTAANDLADKATRAFAAVELDSKPMAKQFHQLYHVPAHTLCLKFKISQQLA
ncbi:hypothetical protein STEG23_019171 [Scotinomys teguina]